MRCTIKPGIASVVNVESTAFPLRFGERSECYVYLSKEKGIVKSPGSTVEFGALPVKVREALHKHFEAVFALSIEQREMPEPFVVEVEE